MLLRVQYVAMHALLHPMVMGNLHAKPITQCVGTYVHLIYKVYTHIKTGSIVMNALVKL